MSFTTLAVTKLGHVAEIRLTRPDHGNPVDASFLDELDAAAASIHEYADIHVALLTAEGDAFSRGAPADGIAPSPDRLPFRCLELMAQPVIACIQGEAIGAGLELALACDIRIAAEGATFAIRDVAAGAVPSAGATQRLPRLIGRGKASEMILLGEELDAQTALACGLVSAVVPRADLEAHARALAERIAAQGPIAVRYAKEAMRQGLDMPLEQALRYETDLTIILQTTADRAEGVSAFLEKRKPRFEGK
jgi:enoyl-CoA hydratase/carnithine racemase